MGGGFPIDIILFAMIAVFLVLRLRSVLGRREGYEHPPERVAPGEAGAQALPRAGAPVIDGVAEPARAREVPPVDGPLGRTLAGMAGIDATFSPAGFLNGAEGAFRIIVEAFARGDRVGLRPLLSDDTYAAFEHAIAAREAAGETQRTELRAIERATIEAAELHGSMASVTVRFVSDQVNITLGRDGLPVAGTDAVTEITDLWTFERDLATRDPTWRLVAARSA